MLLKQSVFKVTDYLLVPILSLFVYYQYDSILKMVNPVNYSVILLLYSIRREKIKLLEGQQAICQGHIL